MTENKSLIKVLGKLMENKKVDHKHEYGCVMLFFDFPQINKIHDSINPKDIYEDPNDSSFGLEKDPHTTLLFGLHDGVSLEDVTNVLDKFTFSTCKIYNSSLFENEKYDVLKFDVKGENLKASNKELCKFPHTNKFPDYHPHLTIAYLKPGTGKKYVKILKDQEFELVPQYAVYSEIDGTKTKISINVD